MNKRSPVAGIAPAPPVYSDIDDGSDSNEFEDDDDIVESSQLSSIEVSKRLRGDIDDDIVLTSLPKRSRTDSDVKDSEAVEEEDYEEESEDYREDGEEQGYYMDDEGAGAGDEEDDEGDFATPARIDPSPFVRPREPTPQFVVDRDSSLDNLALPQMMSDQDELRIASPLIDGDETDDSAFAFSSHHTREEFAAWLDSCRRSGTEPSCLLGVLLEEYDTSRVPPTVWWKVLDAIRPFIEMSLVCRRVKLTDYNTLEDTIDLLNKCSRVVVLTGAGISVSCGIPDFRSRDGIYARLRMHYDLPEPEAMFDINYFRKNPDAFYSFAHELWPGTHEPSITHRFIAALEARGKLLRCFTQNIDTLEQKAGISRVYQCHGSFSTASCLSCKQRVAGKEIEADILARRRAYCRKCRTDPSAKFEDQCYGLMKPDIVFFGESLGVDFHRSLLEDLASCDLAIVIGSSLKVHPVASALEILPPEVPLILINREVVGAPHQFDVELLGDCDGVTATLASRLGWSLSGVVNAAPVAFDFIEPNRYLFPGYRNSRMYAEEEATEEHVNLEDWMGKTPASRKQQAPPAVLPVADLPQNSPHFREIVALPGAFDERPTQSSELPATDDDLIDDLLA